MAVSQRSRELLLLLILCAVGGSLGCSRVNDFSGIPLDIAAVKSVVESEIGGEVQVGWSVYNNRITVTIVFDRLPEAVMGVEEFKERVTQVVTAHLSRTVGKIIISI